MDDYEQSMYEGGADFGTRPRGQPLYNNDDDDDLRSGKFHSELREQFKNANTSKKVNGNGILKNGGEGGRPNTAGKKESR